MKAAFFRFIDVLSRMSTAVWALGLLAFASVVGTFVVQLTSHEVLEARYGIFWAEVFSQLQVDKLYSAWWFLALAGFLVLSVTTCLFRNGPRLWRQLRAGKTPPNLNILRSWPATWEGEAEPDKLEKALLQEGFSKKKHFKTGDSYWIKGKAGRWGYYLTHGAVVLLSLGAILTGVFGYRLTLHLVEGEVFDYAAKWQEGQFLPQNLPFALRNNETQVEHYFTGMPRQFRTDLSLKTPDGEEKRIWLEVNKPVDFAGHRIYQADYGDGGSAVKVHLRSLETGAVLPLRLEGRTGFREDIYPDDDITFTPNKLQPNTVLDLPGENGMGETSTGRIPTNIGPSVEITVETPTAAPRVIKLFENRPWLIGLAERPSGVAQIEENITEAFDMLFLGLDPSTEQGWPLVAALMADTPPTLKDPEELKNYYTAKLPKIGRQYLKDLPEQQRLQQGLGAVMAATALQRLELPFVPVLAQSEFKPFSGVIIAYDPGMWLFVLGGVLLILGSCFMIYSPLVRLWVRQTPKKNVILIAASSRKEAALPSLKELDLNT